MKTIIENPEEAYGAFFFGMVFGIIIGFVVGAIAV